MDEMSGALDAVSNALGPLAVVVAIFVVVWWILLFLLPFFVYGAWQRAKECSRKLDRLIEIQQAAHADKPGTEPRPSRVSWS